MTLDDAIKHYQQVAKESNCGKYANEHKQLAQWLQELKEFKKMQTNEEWFNTLSTKEKAEWIDKVAENCCQICDKEYKELCRGNIAIGCKFENAKKWELWLKQPHTEVTNDKL